MGRLDATKFPTHQDEEDAPATTTADEWRCGRRWSKMWG